MLESDILEKQKGKFSLLLKSFTLIAIFWTIVILALSFWIIQIEKEKVSANTLGQARSFFKQIVTTRYWNSLHGGVYVPVTEQTKPNPYLDITSRDIILKDNKKLTLINPAYMTRQIAEIASGRDQVQFHITSSKPIRPGNAPKMWEAKALSNFSTQSDEYFSWEIPNDKGGKMFRYMAPLLTETPCLKCHAKQGYNQGDIRGGISVSIPAHSIWNAFRSQIQTIKVGFFLIWILGISGIILSYRLISHESKKRLKLIEELQNALHEVKILKGFIPICTSCKKVRDDKGYWDQIEVYIRDRSEVEFSHSICPECREKFYPDISGSKEKKEK